MIDQVLQSGTRGHFWPSSPNMTAPEGEPERGYARIEDGWVAVDVLEAGDSLGDAFQRYGEPPPGGLVGIMPEDSALFLELRIPQRTARFGGYPRVSSKRYHARTAIGGLPVDRLRSPRLLSLEARFHGLARWARMTALQERHDLEDGLVRAWTGTLKGLDDVTANLTSSCILRVSTADWRVGGPNDRRLLSAPLTIGCESNEPSNVWTLLQPILRTQDLFGFAFDGFVAAEGGSARADVEEDESERGAPKPTFWNGALMVPHPGVRPPESMNKTPLFDLDTVGHVRGLVRWVRLAQSHPRAVNPVVSIHRLGSTALHTRLMEIASGIEYWVKVHRPGARWASRSLYAQALANKVGKAFSDWVGDPDLWQSAFWSTYNLLKHEPTADPDPEELFALAESARYLLGAALLDRVAGSKAPSRLIFKSWRLHDLGVHLRKRFAPAAT
jgi:hypothetical protein